MIVKNNKMIKVFTTDKSARLAGDDLTTQFNDWVKKIGPDKIEIVSTNSNSNKFGWMLVVEYVTK